MVLGTPARIVLKRKNFATHMEVTLKPKPAKVAPSKGAPALESLPDDQQALINKAICYITLNRLGKLLSKTGYVYNQRLVRSLRRSVRSFRTRSPISGRMSRQRRRQR
jgi:hypothetical protein